MKRYFILLFTLALVCICAGAAEATVSRGDFVAALWQGAGGVPSAVPTAFTDVGQNDDCAEPVGWACERGLVLGVGDALFAADRSITREEAATLLRRYYDFLGRDTFLPDGVAECNDYLDISPWADDALYWATDEGILPWSAGGRLDPRGTLTHTQTTQILGRVFS